MKQHLQINSQIWPLPNKEKDDANYQKPDGVLEGTTHPLKQNKVETSSIRVLIQQAYKVLFNFSYLSGSGIFIFLFIVEIHEWHYCKC